MSGRKLRWATFLAPNIEPLYRRVTKFASSRLGVSCDLEVGRSFGQVERKEIDVAFLCGLPYVLLTRNAPGCMEPLAAPVLAGTRYAGRPIYYSDVVVRTDSPFATLSDLRGRSWAFNERKSHSGYNLTKYQLTKMGETSGFFGTAVKAGWHERSMQMVIDREIDASAIDSHVLEVAQKQDLEIAAKLRVIDTFGPSTIQPVAAGVHVDPGLREDLRSVLVEMHLDAELSVVLKQLLVTRFVAVEDSDYDDIRAMLAAVEDAGTVLGPEVSGVPALVPPEVSLPE
jgi:phosphate/phosphite/phosphonate ABC transporter binding protein